MKSPVSKRAIKYIAEIRHVREVSLHGNADLAFWSKQLSREALFPFNDHGWAELVIVGADME